MPQGNFLKKLPKGSKTKYGNKYLYNMNGIPKLVGKREGKWYMAQDPVGHGFAESKGFELHKGGFKVPRGYYSDTGRSTFRGKTPAEILKIQKKYRN